MTDCTNILLQSSLELESKPYLVVLTTHSLIWEDNQSISDHYTDNAASEPLFNRLSYNVPINEIIAVNLKRSTRPDPPKRPDACCIELIPLWPCAFTVTCVKRAPKHRWKTRTLTFGAQDTSTCDAWITRIRALLANPALNRPRNLLVFVNPFGGKKEAPRIYREKVAPLFELSGIDAEVIVTQRANHAQQIMEEYDCSKLDGVVCVGGDGMFAEIYNGLLTHTQRINNNPETLDQPPIRPALHIGIIPAGSTDTVVYSTTGINDPVTSTLHIIVGDSLGLDVSAIHNKHHLLCYNVSMLGYGFMGDVVENSEHHRWMGPKRYNYCGFKKWMANKSYEGEVSFLLSEDSVNHPRDTTRCWNGCKVCQSAKEKKCTNNTSTIDMSGGWQRVKGRFMAVNSQTMSCRCTKSELGPSPCCHLGDGCADLVLVHECSRVEYVRYLLRCASRTADQFDFPFVTTYRIKEFVFNALINENEVASSRTHSKKGHKILSRGSSVWNCDGEVIDHADIHVRVHCQLIHIFARGIEEETIPEARCSSCCGKDGLGKAVSDFTGIFMA